MAAFQTGLARRPRAVGLKLVVIFVVVVAVIGAWVGAYYWLKHSGQSGPIDRMVEKVEYGWPSWMPRGKPKQAMYTEAESNGVTIDARDEELKRMRREMDALRRDLDAEKNKKPAVAAPAKAPAPPSAPKSVKRPPLGFISHERKEEMGEDPDQLDSGTFIQGTLQTTLNSEIEGYFTIKTSRPVFDSLTGQRVLIPQGQSIVAKDTSSALLFGNERIPTFAVRMNLPGGREVDLGDAPVMDATGTNGLTGEINNHTWRLVWTSILIEGLQLGQQVVNQGLANQSEGITITGVGQHSGNLAKQRLGRAQDTRPTIIAAAGDIVNVLVTKAIRIPPSRIVSR